jgi:membrane-bound lytic murein transglycosylase D
MGNKLSIIFLLHCSVLISAKAQNPIAPDSVALHINSSTTTPSLTLWQTDSCLYAQRLDSLQSEICLVYNTQVQKHIRIYTGYRKNEICNMLEQGQYYFPIFEKALKAYHIPALFKYLPVIESALNVHAVSPSGATGLWQFMYATGKNYHLIINEYLDERKDPIQASYAAAKYIREAYNELGDWLLALAAYNSGTGAIKRAIVKAGTKNYWQLQPYLSAQTQKYIPAFIAATYIMEYPHRHQITASKKGTITQVDTVYVTQNIHLKTLNNSLSLPQHQLLLLNPSYKKGIIRASPQNPQRLVIPQVTCSHYANLYDALNGDSFVESSDSTVQINNTPIIKPEVATASAITLHVPK